MRLRVFFYPSSFGGVKNGGAFRWVLSFCLLWLSLWGRIPFFRFVCVQLPLSSMLYVSSWFDSVGVFFFCCFGPSLYFVLLLDLFSEMKFNFVFFFVCVCCCYCVNCVTSKLYYAYLIGCATHFSAYFHFVFVLFFFTGLKYSFTD